MAKEDKDGVLPLHIAAHNVHFSLCRLFVGTYSLYQTFVIFQGIKPHLLCIFPTIFVEIFLLIFQPSFFLQITLWPP